MNRPPHLLPAPALEALQRGQLIEAIKLLRQQTGLGLKDAKDTVDRYRKNASADRLSPGEVPPAGGSIWWAVVLVLVFVLGYLLLRRFA